MTMFKTMMAALVAAIAIAGGGLLISQTPTVGATHQADCEGYNPSNGRDIVCDAHQALHRAETALANAERALNNLDDDATAAQREEAEQRVSVARTAQSAAQDALADARFMTTNTSPIVEGGIAVTAHAYGFERLFANAAAVKSFCDAQKDEDFRRSLRGNGVPACS